MASTPIAVICLATGWSGFNVDIGSTGVLPNTSSGELGEWCSSASSRIPVGIRLAAEGWVWREVNHWARGMKGAGSSVNILSLNYVGLAWFGLQDDPEPGQSSAVREDPVASGISQIGWLTRDGRIASAFN
jgi:hypothetical protein